MKLLYFKIVILLITCASLTAQADQHDNRLVDLFSRLQTTEDERMARLVTEDIWNIWSRYDNQKVMELFHLGEAAMNMEDYESALEYFNQVVEIAPGFSEAWNKRATAYYQSGDYQASLADIVVTLKLEPRHFGAITGRALCYMKLDKWQLALDTFKQALAINPWLPRVNQNVKSLKQLLHQSV